jgi:hypothetical protein
MKNHNTQNKVRLEKGNEGNRVAVKTDIICEKNKLNGKILPLLKGKVFHVTSLEAYKEIVRDGMIVSNIEGQFRYTFPQSAISYGRKRGYVCLFDLRNKSNKVIEEALWKYYFLNPPFCQNKPVFLILSSKLYSDLIYDTQAKREAGYNEMYIPYIECWYRDNIPLEKIDKIIEVTIL